MTGPLDTGSFEGPAADDAASPSHESPTRRPDLGRILAVVVAVASVGLATWIVVHYMNKPQYGGMDRVTYWRCLSVACGKDFSMTIAEFRDTVEKGPPGGEVPELTLVELNAQSVCGLSPDKPLWCPHCGTYFISRGYPCQHCGNIVQVGTHGRLAEVCDSCGKDPGEP
jgi:hypothetical protein